MSAELCGGFVDKKTGKVWTHSDVIRYINKLRYQASLKSANANNCNTTNQAAIDRVIEESRQRVRSGKVLGASATTVVK